MLFLAFGVTPQEAVSNHSQVVNEVNSYHLHIEFHTAENDQPGMPVVKTSETEAWCSGFRHRTRERVYFVFAPEGMRSNGPHGDVVDSSVEGTTSRVLSGWDHEHPLELPINFGRNAKEFSTVSCSIQPWDPTQRELRASQEFGAMGWQIRPGWSLAEVVAVAQVTAIPQEDEQFTRFQLHSIEDPDLNSNGLSVNGTIIDIDHAHGWQISRMETPFADSSIVSEVTDFARTESGYWYPAETQSKHNGVVCSLTKVLDAAINVEIDEDDLKTPFPEGAHVVEFPDRLHHIWGTQGPLKTFNTSEALMESIYADARMYQEQLIDDQVRGRF